MQRYLLTIACLTMLTALTATADEELILHIPKLAAPPVIDGQLAPGEWDRASAITAFQGAISHTAYPEAFRMVWYMGYDDECLYLAMDAIFPESIRLKAEGKEADDGWTVLRDDHVEIQVSTQGRQGAKTAGKGFYKFLINPRDTLVDTWYYNGTPGTEDLWSSGARIKSSVTPTAWRLEIAWPWQTMRLKDPDRQSIILHISRAVSGTGWYFASSAPGTWDMWDGFYRAVLSPDAPVVRFLRKGELVKGQLDTAVEVKGVRRGPVAAEVAVLDEKGKALFTESKSLSADGTLTFRAKDLPITTEGNRFTMTVSDADGLLYNTSVPFVELTPEYEARYLKPWLEDRPKAGDYKVTTAFIASRNVVRAGVDLDVFGGLPPAFDGAKSFRVTVKSADGAREVAAKTFPLQGLEGIGVLALGELPEGNYQTEVAVLDGAGKVIDAKSVAFSKQHYPWEGNQLGMAPVVVPAFRPLAFEANRIKGTRSTWTVGDAGLFDGIAIDDTPLLAGPMRIEAATGDTAATWQGAKATIEHVPGRAYPDDFMQYLWQKHCPKLPLEQLAETDGYAARVASSGKAGGVPVAVAGTLDYDGFYRVKVTYGPKTGSVAVDRLDLVVPLAAWADVFCAGRTFGDAQAGRLPAGDGVLWESNMTAAQPRHFKGTWIPYAYVGNGSKGLWYLGESDRGWLLDDAKPCVFIERQDGHPVLRLRLVNKPATLDRERTAEVAFLVTPAKRRPANYRRYAWSPGCPSAEGDDLEPVLWFNGGWRKYGYSGDGFYMPSPDDFAELGQWLNHPEQFKTKPAADNWWTGWITRRKEAIGEDAWLNRMPVVMYSSHSNFSPDLPELATYSGEWLGKDKLEPGRDFGYNKRALGVGTSMTGRYTWDTPARVGEVFGQWTQSLQDCYVWYHRQLFELGNVNGTFYDNAGLVYFRNVDAGLGYVRDDGWEQPQTNIFMRHGLTRRLSVMLWQMGKPPLFYPNAGTFDFAFDQRLLAIEGDWYIWNVDGTLFDANTVDGIRAYYLGKGNEMTIATHKKATFANGTAGTSHRPMRSVFALCVLLDIGAGRLGFDAPEANRIKTLLDQEIGFFAREGQAEFLPYWENRDRLTFATAGKTEVTRETPGPLFVSAYRQPGKVLLWLVNESDQRLTSDLLVDDQKLLGKRAKLLRDAETGEEMTRLRPTKQLPEQGLVWPHIYVPPKDFRILILE